MSNSSFSPTPTNEGGPPVKWRVLQVPGLVPDSIGNYLASIGLLVLAERKWTGIRGCWRCDQFLLVNGPADFTSLVAFLVSIAESNGWSDYGRNWGAEQKADTKAKNTETTGQWRSLEAKELELPLFHSHLALGERLSFNPLFGSGGNAGRRDFATGWKKAVSLLAKAKGKTKELLEDDLSSFLAGGSCNHLDDYSAGSWFSSANKIYNSGTKRPFRNGQVTPWAMALACESFRLLMGGTSRQLGSYRATTGAFPFVTTAAAPESAGEAGRSIGELWLPIWSRPTSVVEAATLFNRGRAEIRGRGAITAPAFSVAILQRGVDAGITEFRRFALFHTTSENTFESCLAVVVPAMKSADSALAVALDVALDLRDSLPRDWKKGKRWIYAGLRGPLDRALIELSACPGPAAKRSLVDALVVALRAVDRNRSHRKHNVRFRLLPAAWTDSLIGEHDEITPEIRLAYAIASIRPSHTIPQVETARQRPRYWRTGSARRIKETGGRFRSVSRFGVYGARANSRRILGQSSVVAWLRSVQMQSRHSMVDYTSVWPTSKLYYCGNWMKPNWLDGSFASVSSLGRALAVWRGLNAFVLAVGSKSSRPQRRFSRCSNHCLMEG